MSDYRPSCRVSKRISAVLLRAMERGALEGVGYKERSLCVAILISRRPLPGQCLVVGRLWRAYGSQVPESLLDADRVEDREMIEVMAA